MNELTVVDQSPAELMRVATDVAGLCKQIVEETSHTIGGKKHPPVEAWMTIATAHGCVASADEPKRLETGFQSRGYLKRMSDGMVIAEAYGFVGDDEPVWAKRPEYAKRAMAQTRAISRACRSAFAHVVTMMRIKGMSTTPYEEIPHEEDKKPMSNDEYRSLAEARTPAGVTKTATNMQDVQGKLTGVAFANGWWNAFVKGIKFGTQDQEFEQALWTMDNSEVVATIETKKTKDGKPWFKLVKLVPSSMNQGLNIKPEDENQDTDYEPGSEG